MKIFGFLAVVLACVSCTADFLDVKSNKNLVVPNKINDYAALLEETRTMNSASSHVLGLIGADEYFITDGVWQALTARYQKNAYIWAKEVYEGAEVDDWNNAYKRILHANIVLEGLDVPGESDKGEITEWNRVKGMALFHRAFNFYQLAQLFCEPYMEQTAAASQGIPLRLEADITIPTTRASILETYNRIIADLREAASLLPEETENRFIPSKAAAYALLARTLLNMGAYNEALDCADRSLAVHGELADFNELDLEATYTFPSYGENNPEVLFMSYMLNITITNSSRFNADTNLLAMYDHGDLRRHAYFFSNAENRVLFKGSYTGANTFFTGLAVDEVLLIRAECLAMLGDWLLAREELDRFRKNRYATEHFMPLQIEGQQRVMDAIINERRKELVLRGTRWEDLRRLNRNPTYRHALVRTVNGQTHTLEPNSPRWTWAIPDLVVEISGVEQNVR